MHAILFKQELLNCGTVLTFVLTCLLFSVKHLWIHSTEGELEQNLFYMMEKPIQIYSSK